MTRKEELMAIVCRNDKQNSTKAERLIDEIVFLEEQLVDVKRLPFISVNPKNPAQQKSTPAAKVYKELLSQYNNSLRLLFKLSGDIGDVEEESPLRKWVNSRKGEFDGF